MAKIEAILGAARTRTMRRTKANLEKGRQPPEKMFIFGKSFIKKLRPSAFPLTGFPIERIMMPYAFKSSNVVKKCCTSLLSINVNKLNFSDRKNLMIA